MTFRDAVDVHNFFGFVLIGNFALWLVYYIVTGKIKIYIPPLSPKKFVTGCIRQAKYYGYGIFIGEENPHHSTPDNKFNPMQSRLSGDHAAPHPPSAMDRAVALGRLGSICSAV
jgi:thiosulfate reductase cytochrome b subunit